MMSNSLVIGVDIGGTRTKYGLVKMATGEVLTNVLFNTEKKDAGAFLRQLEMVISDFTNLALSVGQGIAGIGIGVPGFTSGSGEVVTTYGFIDFMENYPLKAIIEKAFDLPCILDNDARVVSMGEALFGKGKPFRRVLTLTLGTGVGFGFVVNGALTDPTPFEHMGGHMSVTQKGGVCYCGKTGCLEFLVSSGGIVRAARNIDFRRNDFSVESVFAAALQGHKKATLVVEDTIGYLQTAIYNYINLFAPDIVVLGGGVSRDLEPYLKKIKSDAYLPPYPSYTCKVAISTLQELGGILGGAALFHAAELE